MSNIFSSESINELSEALSKAQGQMKAAVMDRNNPFFKSKFASLNSIWDACRIPLSNNHLSVMQCMTMQDDSVVLVTTLSHSSGQWMRSYMPACNKGVTPQAMGSAISYARRYSLSAICGISVDEDDDGNAAQKASEKVSEKPSQSTNVSQELITKDEVEYLESMLLHCKSGFKQDDLFPKLKTILTYDIKSLSELPSAMFERTHKYISEQQKKS